MSIVRAPGFKLVINSQFDVTAAVSPWLISINLEDIFDTDFTVSKLELIFHAKYRRSINWQFKDKLNIELFWQTDTTQRFVSNVFYIDHITNILNTGGLQTFRVSALEADPTLGYNYGVNQVQMTNTTIGQALTSFKNAFGLTMVENATPNVYMGTIPSINTATDLNNVTASFNSYADMLKYITKTYGYFGNVSGKTVTVLKISTPMNSASSATRFIPPSVENVFSVDFTQTYNPLNKEYRAMYVNRNNSNTITELVLQPIMFNQLNNKIKKLEIDSGYYNVESGTERLYGELYQDFYSAFQMRIKCQGSPYYVGGNIFLLDATYGSSEGYYRCTKAHHIIDGNGWTTEITGFPLKILNAYQAWFYTGYLGRTNNPNQVTSITQTIAGIVSSEVTASVLNAFVRLYNPNYSENYLELGADLGALYIQECNKTGNSIRADIAFCQALTETDNLTSINKYNAKNPGGILNSAGTSLHNFADWTTGVRAHVQHLFAFSKSTGNPADTIVDPRYGNVTRGSATTIDMLQDKWNSEYDYSLRTKWKLAQLWQYLYPKSSINYSN